MSGESISTITNFYKSFGLLPAQRWTCLFSFPVKVFASFYRETFAFPLV